jgi:hypothetical protein
MEINIGCVTGPGLLKKGQPSLLREVDIYGMGTELIPMNGTVTDEGLDLQKRFDETLDPLMQEGIPDNDLPFWGNDPVSEEFEKENLARLQKEYASNVNNLLEAVEAKDQTLVGVVKYVPVVIDFTRIIYLDPVTGLITERMEPTRKKPSAEYLGPPVEGGFAPIPETDGSNHPISYDPKTGKVEGSDDWHEDPIPQIIKSEITEPYKDRIKVDKLTIRDLIDFGFMTEILQMISPSLFELEEEFKA